MARNSSSASYIVVLQVVCIVAVVSQARHILQDDRVEAFLINVWDKALNCSRCSVPYTLQECVTYPVINYRVQNRNVESQKVQELLNTLIVHPSCVLAQFREFSTVQVAITDQMSPELYVLPSWARYERNVSELYPLLPNCYLLSGRNNGSRVMGEEVFTKSDSSDNTTDLQDGQLANIVLTFDKEDISLPGETTAASETKLQFFMPQIEFVNAEQPPYNFNYQQNVGSDAFYGVPYVQPNLSQHTNATVSEEEVAGVSSQPTNYSRDTIMSFTFFNTSLNYCQQLQNNVQSNEFLEFWEQSLPCSNCTQFSVLCTPNITLIAILSTSVTQQFVNTAFFTPSCVLHKIQNTYISQVSLTNYPPQILNPALIQSNLSLIDSCTTQSQNFIYPNGESYRRIQTSNGSVILVQEREFKRNELEGMGVQEQGQGQEEQEGEGGSLAKEVWIPVFCALALVVLIIIVALILLKRSNSSAGGLVPSVSGGPGKQAVLFARAEQFGYTPSFRLT